LAATSGPKIAQISLPDAHCNLAWIASLAPPYSLPPGRSPAHAALNSLVRDPGIVVRRAGD
jgi:hypothetical protein